MYGEDVNYSVNRKVLGILNSFKLLGFEPEILRTNDGINCKSKNKTEYYDSQIKVIDTCSTNKNFPRIINYVRNIIKNTLVLKKIKDHYQYVIFWDFLPDTFLPVFLSKIEREKVIIDIEESISHDPEASYIFKLFEAFCLRIYSTQIGFESKKGLNQSSERTISINGFFAQTIQEEEYCYGLLQNYSRINKPRIFYASRFDENRGIDVLVNLIKLDSKNQYFKFEICGFGSKFYLEKLKSINHPELSVNYEISRNEYLRKLVNSEASINILKNDDFAANSFPSKLIEYLCLGGLIFSNIHYQELETNFIKISLDYNSMYDQLIDTLIKSSSSVRHIEINKQNISKYTLEDTSEKIKTLITTK